MSRYEIWYDPADDIFLPYLVYRIDKILWIFNTQVYISRFATEQQAKDCIDKRIKTENRKIIKSRYPK